MHRTPVRQRAIIALALVPALAACDAADRPDATPADADSLVGALGTAEFAPVNRSDITGTVRFEEDDDEATATVELVGLEPGAEYPVQLYTGRCAAGGSTPVPLGRVTGGEDGRGRLTARVAVTDLPAGEPVFVQADGPDASAVACADMADDEADDEEMGAEGDV